MNQYNIEYAIILIKPDGYEKKIMEEVIEFYKKFGLEVVYKNTLQLHQNQIYEAFTSRHDGNKLSLYLTRGPVIAILVKGVDAYRIVRLKKVDLRNHFGVDGMIENMIHSPEAGNEYDEQFRIYFPQLVEEKYHQYADLYVKENFSHDTYLMQKKMKNIINHTNARCCFIISNEEYPSISQVFHESLLKYDKKNVLFGVEFTVYINSYITKLVGYFRNGIYDQIAKERQYCHTNVEDVVNLISENGGVAYIGYTPHRFDFQQEIFYKIAQTGIYGVLIYHPQYTIAETEILREYSLQAGLHIAGGSGGLTRPGRFGVSYEIYNHLYSKFFSENQESN